jgi:NAD(P)-dependent dehydrogenase (short-subunit alcohol dehydrogenase family)
VKRARRLAIPEEAGMGELSGKAAIVTGATSGIGEACAVSFARHGAAVALVGRNRERGFAVEAAIRSEGFSARFIECDVTDETQVVSMIARVREEFGRIDILFNNAGVFMPSVELERLELESWRETFGVNLEGYFLVTKHAKPHLRESKGVILNNASIAGMHSYAIGRAYAYSASKAAVIQFTRMMAKNYAEEGLRVNSISPGVIWTPMMHDRDKSAYLDRIPMKRIGEPEDVAKVALFLVSEASAYVTGVNVPIDGGVSI